MEYNALDSHYKVFHQHKLARIIKKREQKGYQLCRQPTGRLISVLE
jgi:hypothetical protein